MCSSSSRNRVRDRICQRRQTGRSAASEFCGNQTGVKISFSSWLDHDRPTKVTIMQIQPPTALEEIELTGSAPPVSVDAAAHLEETLEPIRGEALLLLRPNREPVLRV